MRRLHVDDQDLAEMHDLGSTQADGVEFGAEGEAPRAPQRTEWPELVATEAGRARDAILNERPELLVQTVDADAMVTMDFRNDRVRLFVDADNFVVRTPRVG